MSSISITRTGAWRFCRTCKIGRPTAISRPAMNSRSAAAAAQIRLVPGSIRARAVAQATNSNASAAPLAVSRLVQFQAAVSRKPAITAIA